jgi:hypothetical protein
MHWSVNECGKTNVMEIAQIVIEQKQLEIVDYINYLFSMITNNVRCEIQ